MASDGSEGYDRDPCEEILCQRVLLEHPRPLSDHERALLDRLLSSPAATPELRAQAEVTTVSAHYSCGCPSILLAVPDDAPLARLDPTDPATRYGEYLAIQTSGTRRDGRSLDVTLHVLGGRLVELEVWGDDVCGAQPTVELPDVSTITFWGPPWQPSRWSRAFPRAAGVVYRMRGVAYRMRRRSLPRLPGRRRRPPPER